MSASLRLSSRREHVSAPNSHVMGGGGGGGGGGLMKVKHSKNS